MCSVRAKSWVHGMSGAVMKLCPSQTTRLTCSFRSRSRTTTPPRSSTSTSRWNAGPAWTSTHHTPRAWVVGSEVRRTPSRPGPQTVLRRVGGQGRVRAPPELPAAVASAIRGAPRGYVAPGTVARDTEAVTERELAVQAQVDGDRSADHREPVAALGEAHDRRGRSRRA